MTALETITSPSRGPDGDGQHQHRPSDQKPRPVKAAAFLLPKKAISERLRPDVTQPATETGPQLATLQKKDPPKGKGKWNPVYKEKNDMQNQEPSRYPQNTGPRTLARHSTEEGGI